MTNPHPGLDIEVVRGWSERRPRHGVDSADASASYDGHTTPSRYDPYAPCRPTLVV